VGKAEMKSEERREFEKDPTALNYNPEFTL
jgi:hypothetical protein